MASVYYLLDDALHISDEILEKYSEQEECQRENHGAAAIIQRTFRGYKARKEYKKYKHALIILQKYVKGWLVRYHLPDIMQERWDQNCMRSYDRAALKIQTYFRGYLVRRVINAKKIISDENYSEPELVSADFGALTAAEREITEETWEEQQKNEDLLYSPNPTLPNATIFKLEMLEIMFDHHHLISTKLREGILHSSGLKGFEEILKSLPWRNYIRKLRKIYYEAKKAEENVMSKYNLRDRSGDFKEEDMSHLVIDYRKPFNLHLKLEKPPYEKSLFSEEKHGEAIKHIQRTEDKSKNISDKEFVLSLKKVAKECDVPPYYVDFWYKECLGHYLLR